MNCSRIIPIVLMVLVMTSGCDSWVEDVEVPKDAIADDELTSEDQVSFLMYGVLSQFDRTHAQAAFEAANLSDELFFDRIRNSQSRSITYEQIDNAIIPLGNFFSNELFWDIARLRFLADDLVRRLNDIDFSDEALKRKAEYTGYLYGALARFYLAAYYGLTEREGGGVITFDPADPGRFIPSDEMYRLALEKLEPASASTVAEEARIANTIRARIFLILEDYGPAREAAESGMIVGDPPFQSLHDASNRNSFWGAAGPGSAQLLADFAYEEYVDADTAEVTRIPMVPIVGRDSTILYRQNRYTKLSDPIWFCTWQENELILAELDLEGENSEGALFHVNTVRLYHNLAPLVEIDWKALEVERRKELWLMGLRLIDQRRFETWHKGPDTWWNLPIPQTERDTNPNL